MQSTRLSRPTLLEWEGKKVKLCPPTSLFRLLRKLDNIEKVEKEMTEDRPSFF